jgi:hypothetical protein
MASFASVTTSRQFDRQMRGIPARNACALLLAAALQPLCSPSVHAAPLAVQAAEDGTDVVISMITTEELRSIMKAEGYETTFDKDGDVVWKIEGFKSHVFVAKDGKAIQFHSSFSDGNATLKKVNEWNRTKRFSRTYLDDDGDPHLELDLDMDGGVTVARLLDFLKTCRVSFDAWCRDVVE